MLDQHLTEVSQQHSFLQKEEDRINTFHLESSVIDNTHVDIFYSDARGRASLFFVSNEDLGPDGEVVLSSGYVSANPQGVGLGTILFQELGHALEVLASETGKVIVHPLFPSNEDAQRFFERQGYQPDSEQKWRRTPDDSFWYAKIYRPRNQIAINEKERECVHNFKIIRQDLVKE